MEKNFQNMMNKNTRNGKRVNIKLVTSQLYPFSSIDLTTLLTKLSSLYYKTDLLISMAHSVNNGIDVQELNILSRSLRNTSSISRNKLIDVYKDVDLLIRHGFMQTLSTKTLQHEFSLFFESIKDINNSMSKNGLSKLRTDDIKPILINFKNNGFDKSITDLYSLPKKNIYDKIGEYPFLIKELENSLERVKSFHKSIVSDLKILEDLNKLLICNQKTQPDKIERKLIGKYIDPFFDNFCNCNFPIIMLNKDTNYHVLCHYHFDDKYYDHPFYFDIKEVSHNSPTLIDIVSAAVNMAPLIAVYIIILKTRKLQLENQLTKASLDKLAEKQKQKREILQQINLISKLINEYSAFQGVYDKNIVAQINNIKSDFYRKKFNNLLKILLADYEKALKEFDLELRGMSLE